MASVINNADDCQKLAGCLISLWFSTSCLRGLVSKKQYLEFEGNERKLKEESSNIFHTLYRAYSFPFSASQIFVPFFFFFEKTFSLTWVVHFTVSPSSVFTLYFHLFIPIFLPITSPFFFLFISAHFYSFEY